METNGIGNVPNFQNANDVVNNANNVANNVSQAAQESQAAQTAMGQLFYSIIQKLMSEARENSSSGA